MHRDLKPASPACVCDGAGYYYSPRCAAKRCDHGERTIHTTEALNSKELTSGKVPKKQKRVQERVMRCPRRPCVCPEGKVHRRDLQRRIELQQFTLGGDA